MPRYSYERLSGQDNDFLVWEKPNLPMHVGGTQIFDAGSLRADDGGIDFEAIKRLAESILHRISRYRQKLVWIPGENHAVWVDDEHFNLDYHFRHTSLPKPGSDEQLKRLSARIMAQALDRSRPLWETWVVEGLSGNRLALISKLHHCMVDGTSGVDMSQVLLSKKPERRIGKSPRFIPRPVPSRHELLRDERRRRLSMPLEAARSLWGFARQTEDVVGEVSTRLRALGGLAQWKAVAASETPLNGPICPHRLVDWTSMSLADIKTMHKKLGCSLNDVVLTIVTGAVRRFMLRRQVDPKRLDFRVSNPVNIRGKNDHKMGNKVSSWVVRLPLGEADPLGQIQAIAETTRSLKDSQQSLAVQMLNTAAEWLPLDIQSASVGTMNMIVTNVPGPQVPLYMLGAEALEMYPYPPLIENVGLAIGILSYNGRLCWGFNADYDLVPDLEEFVHGINRATEQLGEAAGVGVEGSRVLDPRTGTNPAKGANGNGPKAAGARRKKSSAIAPSPSPSELEP